MATKPKTTDEELRPRNRKRRAEHHAELLAGLALQRRHDQSLTEQFAKLTGDVDAFSLSEFCRRHGISLQLFYKLAQQGLAPRTFYVGTRVLVSKEAAAAWRREREAAFAAMLSSRLAAKRKRWPAKAALSQSQSHHLGKERRFALFYRHTPPPPQIRNIDRVPS